MGREWWLATGKTCKMPLHSRLWGVSVEGYKQVQREAQEDNVPTARKLSSVAREH